MSDPVLNLQGIKSLFVKGIDYCKDKFPFGLFQNYDELSDYQKSLIVNAKDLNTVANIISIKNPSFTTRFKGQDKVKSGHELQNTVPEFGKEPSQWFFCNGITGDFPLTTGSQAPKYCFVFSFNKIEIAPPETVNSENIKPEDAVLWNVQLTLGNVNGDIIANINENVQLQFTKLTYSTFKLIGNGNVLKNIIFQTATGNPALNNTNPMQFYFSVDTTDSNNKPLNLSVLMISNTPPLANFPDFVSKTQSWTTFYASYTDTDVVLTYNKEQLRGKGWIDNQSFKIGIPEKLYDQAYLTFLNMLSKPKSGGWLWFCIQDYETGKQYMLTHLFIDKFYEDDIKIGQKIKMQLINVYDKGVAYHNPSRTDISTTDLEVVLTKTVNIDGINLPAQYNITLPGGKPVVLKLATQPVQYPLAYGNYENPSLLYNSSDLSLSNPIGIGIIEANGYYTNDQYAERYIKYAGGVVNSENVKMVSEGMDPAYKQNVGHKFLAVLVILFPLLLLIIALVFTFYKTDNMQPRLAISICLFLILYAIIY